MTDKEYWKLVDELQNSAKELSLAKGKEYANAYSKDFDRLFNFKAIANLLGIAPETTALVYILKPLLSLSSTVKRLEAGEEITEIDGDLTESIKSRIQDVSNYNNLLWALFNERMPKAKEEEWVPVIEKTINRKSSSNSPKGKINE